MPTRQNNITCRAGCVVSIVMVVRLYKLMVTVWPGTGVTTVNTANMVTAGWSVKNVR